MLAKAAGQVVVFAMHIIGNRPAKGGMAGAGHNGGHPAFGAESGQNIPDRHPGLGIEQPGFFIE